MLSMINSGEKNSMQLEFFPRFKTKQYFQPISKPSQDNWYCALWRVLRRMWYLFSSFSRLCPHGKLQGQQKTKAQTRLPLDKWWVGSMGWSTEGTEGREVGGQSPIVSCRTLNSSFNHMDLSFPICKMGHRTGSVDPNFSVKPSLIAQVIFLLPLL